jgi:hypothetical protein
MYVAASVSYVLYVLRRPATSDAHPPKLCTLRLETTWTPGRRKAHASDTRHEETVPSEQQITNVVVLLYYY